MRHGATPSAAAKKAISRIAQHYPSFFGAVIALNRKGEYGAACNGMASFPYYVANPSLGPKLLSVQCSNYNPEYCNKNSEQAIDLHVCSNLKVIQNNV